MKYANYYQPDRVENASFAEVDKHHTYNPPYTNRSLRASFLAQGIELNNPDVNIGKEISFNLYHDGQDIAQDNSAPNYLIATENPYICPLNWDQDYLQKFTGVFTWNSALLKLSNVTHLFIPNQIRQEIFNPFAERAIFSCIINANKAFPKGLDSDLYKERIKVIRWYEKYSSEHFSLYGLGWKKPSPAFNLSEKISRRFKRLATQIYGYKPFPSYAGEIADKSEIYQRTKFAYCYENVADLPNYISEKIFDCFFTGCIPIYWGSHTIEDHIPSSCFIDRRKFNSTGEVHQFLLSVDEKQYGIYQENIKKFLASPEAMQFDTSTYVSTIVDKILKDLKL